MSVPATTKPITRLNPRYLSQAIDARPGFKADRVMSAELTVTALTILLGLGWTLLVQTVLNYVPASTVTKTPRTVVRTRECFICLKKDIEQERETRSVSARFVAAVRLHIVEKHSNCMQWTYPPSPTEELFALAKRDH